MIGYVKFFFIIFDHEIFINLKYKLYLKIGIIILIPNRYDRVHKKNLYYPIMKTLKYYYKILYKIIKFFKV